MEEKIYDCYCCLVDELLNAVEEYGFVNCIVKYKDASEIIKTLLASSEKTSIDGVYIENYGSANEKPVKEKSFIVFDHKKTGKLKADLKRLGLRYDQDSITFNSVSDGNYYLIGTSKRDDSYPGFGKEIKLGKPMFGKSGEFHSSVKGRPFVFEETEDYSSHAYNDVLTNYSTWHIKILTDKAKELLADE